MNFLIAEASIKPLVFTVKTNVHRSHFTASRKFSRVKVNKFIILHTKTHQQNFYQCIV